MTPSPTKEAIERLRVSPIVDDGLCIVTHRDLATLLASHDKLVEGLKWYADQFCELSNLSECRGRLDEDVCCGCKARNLIEELGQ
jgi:hypothetical protein